MGLLGATKPCKPGHEQQELTHTQPKCIVTFTQMMLFNIILAPYKGQKLLSLTNPSLVYGEKWQGNRQRQDMSKT